MTQNIISERLLELEGKIVAVLAGTMFRVELPSTHLVLAHISGKMRKRFIRLTSGDRVKLQMSPYNADKARIVYRIGSSTRPSDPCGHVPQANTPHRRVLAQPCFPRALLNSFVGKTRP